DVAGPHDAAPGVAVLQVLDVRVALDGADLAALDLLAEHVERLHEIGLGEVARDVDALLEHDDADGVAHLAEDGELALHLRLVPQVGDALESVREALDVPADAAEAA